MQSDIKIIRQAARAVGRVQRVGFRMFVRNTAREFGVTGWVKNMSDGSVTMELQGEPMVVEYVIDKIKAGRGRIKVNEFELADLPVAEGETGFAIRK